jgi:hypothetical protein
MWSSLKKNYVVRVYEFNKENELTFVRKFHKIHKDLISEAI